MDQKEEILKRIPVDELPFLITNLKRFLPESVTACQSAMLVAEGKEVNLHFYTPRGSRNYSTVFVISGDLDLAVHSTSAPKVRSVTVRLFTTPDTQSELQRALATTTLLDWTQGIVFGNTLTRDLPIIEDVCEGNGSSVTVAEGNMYYLPIHDAKNITMNIPPNVYLGPLKKEHARLVYDSWKFKWRKRFETIESLVCHLCTAAVFLQDSGQPVAWMIQREDSCMALMHTLEGYRGKGYGKLVASYLALEIAKQGQIPFVNVEEENVLSQKLFESLGFSKGFRFSYIAYVPHQDINGF